MKKYLGVVCVVTFVLMGSFSSIIAGPVPSSNLGREYFISDSDLRLWSFGVYQSSSERDLRLMGVAKLERTMGYVGYDFVPWMTTYVTAGLGKTSGTGAGMQATGNQFNYGLGFHFNIIDKEILDPTLYEDRVRLTAGLQYIAAKVKYHSRDTKFDELSSSLIVTLINDLEGSKNYVPFSLAIFGGLIYSDLLPDSDIPSLQENAAIGFTGGFEVFYTESVSIYIALENIDHSGYTAGLNVRF